MWCSDGAWIGPREFYERAEPSSPVPILLRRAARLVNKSFLDVLRDLIPEGVNQALLYRGQEQEGQT